MASWIIRSDRVVLPDGMRPAAIRVDDGTITAVVRGDRRGFGRRRRHE